MRLFLIDSGPCRYTKDFTPAIFAISQMETEFYPFLYIDYLPYRENETPGIILQTKTATIRKNYTFENKKDIEDLRKLIWYYLLRDYNIKDITKNGCLKDFREYRPNHVVQGWQARKRLAAKDTCCKIVLDELTSEVLKNNILHEVYKLSNKDKQDRNICKKVRFEECGNNYPPNSATFSRCVDEVNWLCNRVYPNKAVDKMDELVKRVRTNLYNYLNKNNLKVNKQKFDEIIDAGLFVDLGNRMGNKVANDANVRASLNNIFTEKKYYLGLIEGFETGNNNLNMIIIFIILLGLIYMLYSKSR